MVKLLVDAFGTQEYVSYSLVSKVLHSHLFGMKPLPRQLQAIQEVSSDESDYGSFENIDS
jgi:hypothetical protein